MNDSEPRQPYQTLQEVIHHEPIVQKLVRYGESYRDDRNAVLELVIVALANDRRSRIDADVARLLTAAPEPVVIPKEDYREMVIEECARAAETQERGTRYQWVQGSLFGGITGEIARRIRSLKRVGESAGSGGSGEDGREG